MVKNILTSHQLKTKLLSYNFHFTNQEFEELLNLGYFHVFNSLVEKRARNSFTRKKLSDYLNLYKIDLKLRNILFTMIIRLENFFKQRLKDTIVEELLCKSILSSHYNEVVKHCIKKDSNVEIKKLLFGSVRLDHQIVSHYFDNHNDIPIWAYLELINLGSFIQLLSKCTDISDPPQNTNKIKEKYIEKCNFLRNNQAMFVENTKASYIINGLNLIKGIRNNIAHNQIIIDGRYTNRRISCKEKPIKKAIIDLSKKLNPKHSPILESDFDVKKITTSIALVYIFYIHAFGKDEYSKDLLIFSTNIIKGNNRSINNILHSKTFGSNYVKIIDFIVSI